MGWGLNRDMPNLGMPKCLHPLCREPYLSLLTDITVFTITDAGCHTPQGMQKQNRINPR